MDAVLVLGAVLAAWLFHRARLRDAQRLGSRLGFRAGRRRRRRR